MASRPAGSASSGGGSWRAGWPSAARASRTVPARRSDLWATCPEVPALTHPIAPDHLPCEDTTHALFPSPRSPRPAPLTERLDRLRQTLNGLGGELVEGIAEAAAH